MAQRLALNCKSCSTHPGTGFEDLLVAGFNHASTAPEAELAEIDRYVAKLRLSWVIRTRNSLRLRSRRVRPIIKTSNNGAGGFRRVESSPCEANLWVVDRGVRGSSVAPLLQAGSGR